MWSKFSLNLVTQILICTIVSLLIVWRVPAVAGGLGTNKSAVEAVSLCKQAETQKAGNSEQAGYVSPSSLQAWLRASVARCSDDTDALDRALRDDLVTSDARLPLARAVAPYDVSLARLATSSHADQAEAHFWLAAALVQHDMIEEAIREYERGLGLSGADANAWLALGNLYRTGGEMPAAVRAYDQACRYVDQGKHGCIDSARVYMDLGMYDVAIERFQASIRQFGYAFIPAEEGLVVALLKLGRTQEAIPHLRILAENGSSEAQNTLARLKREGK